MGVPVDVHSSSSRIAYARLHSMLVGRREQTDIVSSDLFPCAVRMSTEATGGFASHSLVSQ